MCYSFARDEDSLKWKDKKDLVPRGLKYDASS